MARDNTMKSQVQSGERQSLYRSGEAIRMMKEQKKDWPNTWFIRGQVTGTVSCPVTPRSVLKRNLNRFINHGKTDKLTQVIEDGGQPVSSGLCIKDPHRLCIWR